MGIRLAFLALFILVGFLWWPVFLLAALSAYALVNDLSETKKPEPDAWFARKWTTTAADPRWRSDFLRFCESPAEAAFLNAMIDDYGLQPQKGALQGGGLTLELQVKMHDYRVDFLAQGWLVIEVDGEAYHSSAEAVMNDRQRDEFMVGRGYRVLRLPAKLVFGTPAAAVAKVRAALDHGQPVIKSSAGPAEDRSPKTSRFKAGLVLEELNTGIERTRAIRAAMSGPEMTFSLERRVINSALDSAERAIKIEDYLGDDPAKRASFDKFNQELRTALGRSDRKQPDQSSNQRPDGTVMVTSLTAPETHPTVAINDAIQNAYRRLLAERSRYLITQRHRLRDNPALQERAKRRLAELGCPEVWDLVAPASAKPLSGRGSMAHQSPTC